MSDITYTRTDYVNAIASMLRKYAHAEDLVEQMDVIHKEAKAASHEADAAAFHLLAVSQALELSLDEIDLALVEAVEQADMPKGHWTTDIVKTVLAENKRFARALKAPLN